MAKRHGQPFANKCMCAWQYLLSPPSPPSSAPSLRPTQAADLEHILGNAVEVRQASTARNHTVRATPCRRPVSPCARLHARGGPLYPLVAGSTGTGALTQRPLVRRHHSRGGRRRRARAETFLFEARSLGQVTPASSGRRRRGAGPAWPRGGAREGRVCRRAERRGRRGTQ